MLPKAVPNATSVASIAPPRARPYSKRMAYYKPRPPEPAACPQCSYCNGGIFFVCPICKHELLPDLLMKQPADHHFGPRTGLAPHRDVQELVADYDGERDVAGAPPDKSA